MTKKKTKGITSVDDLKAAPWNPREVSEAALSALGYSLSEFGDISGIVYSADSGYLLCGHQRLRALREKHNGKLKVEEGAIVTPDGERFPIRIISGWGDAKEKAANVAANSELIAGRFTPELESVLEDINATLPDLSVELRLGALNPIPLPEEYADLDAECRELNGKEDALITINVPIRHKDTVCEWLANGESANGIGMGKGVMKRCGLL